MHKRHLLDFMECARRFWWSYHEPAAPELAPGLVAQDRMAEGRSVGRAAREALPGREYERDFEAKGISVRVDILERRPDGLGLIEVKASKQVDARQLDDVAIQLHVLRAAGQTVPAAELMHLDPAWRAPERFNLFHRAEITGQAERRLPAIAQAAVAAAAAARGPLPEVPIGPQCLRGKEGACPFVPRCWKEVPEHHVSTLYHIGKKWAAFAASGHHRIADLPDDAKLPRPETRRQVLAIKTGQRVVEPGLRQALQNWPRPLAFLDFETVSSALPRYGGAAAWEQVPVQWSLHHEDGRQVEWMADREPDPREALAEALVAAGQGVATFVAYRAEFERGCLRRLGEAVPRLAPDLDAVERRVVDALPVVRAHVYDPAFGGSFSLKAVQPALVPELEGYQGLSIRDGQIASVLLKRLLAGEPSEAGQRAQLRHDLLAYCRQDTFGLLKLVERLGQLGELPA